ncbi:MAG: hypothetical protein FJ280_14500 [Planctomycetes bacterium]|nr:hypothetical protein [Planctomycetota bacterium]
MTGPLPTLFAGVGPGAAKTLAELCRLAQGLTAPIQGPFGLVLADSRGEGLWVRDWPRAADLRGPEPTAVPARQEPTGDADEKWTAALSSLVRRLRAVEPGPAPVPGGRLRLSAYVVIDLSDAAAVSLTIRLIQTLRQADAALDTTLLVLTGRTAATDAPAEGRWFETCRTLLEQLQDGLLAQRVCLLDGCDTEKTWLERPEQLYRLGGEFLFYHGLTCRGLLRQNEHTRTRAGESILNVCGSFGCRTISADLAVVARRIAERVAREDLAELYRRTVPGGWLESLHEQARSLVERIAATCERACPTTAFAGAPARAAGHAASSSGERRSHPDPHRSQNAEITEAVRRTIKQVCTRESLLSLSLFFQLLRPKLARLLTQQRLWERARAHHLVAEVFRRQEESTYEPLRTWLAQPQTQWVGRFTPAPPEVSYGAVSRPASLRSYAGGWLLLALGLAAVALGTFPPSKVWAIAGGLVSLAATVVMALPIGWMRYPRSHLCERDVLSSVLPVPYRMGPGRRIRLACGGLIALGLIGITWPWWPDTWTLSTGLWAVILLAATGAGLVCAAGGARSTYPDQVSPDEAPGQVNPPTWWRWTLGWLCLASVWIVLIAGSVRGDAARMADAGGQTSSYLLPLMGLVLAAAGIGLALFPRSGHAYLVDRVARMPQPLAGAIANPIQERGLPPGVITLAAWVNGLALEPDQLLSLDRSDDGATHPDTLLDYLAADWEGQLVRAFRQTIEARSGKSLKALALQPALWADCIITQLQDPQGGGTELASVFALQAVKAWLESHTPAELLSFLNIDLMRLNGLLGRLASVHWPAPRVDPDVTVTVVAMGKSVWEMAAPLAKIHGAPVILRDWDAHDDRIVVLRSVQGLTQGWRGFPGLPGQLHGQTGTQGQMDAMGGSAAAGLSEAQVPARAMAVQA